MAERRSVLDRRDRRNGLDLFSRNLNPPNQFNEFVRAGHGTLAEAANLANPAGNCVRWEGLTDSTLTITAEGLSTSDSGAGGDTRRAPVQGLQIVQAADGDGRTDCEEVNPTDGGPLPIKGPGVACSGGQHQAPRVPDRREASEDGVS